ncbi:SDR family NAD(P)-dependent oxidoreductase [Actinomadura sp. B10D3]|uniref:SDR family NAD(P)-dependent oxidoreductase n=1 Tax=Actinomadura sp. B10D3 TaxID=3153557 RepID=UPI00325D253C
MPTTLITGSSTGLGLAMAHRLVADGWRVAVNSRSADRADAAVRSLGGSDHAVAVVGDVADPATAEHVVAQAVDHLGALDLLVNNAGIAEEAPSTELRLDEWTRILSTNLLGAFVCAREAGIHMLSRGGGTIINVGSMWANLGMPQRASYATSKHGLHGLTAMLTREWEARGVRTVTIDPGYIQTTMAASVQGGGNEELERRTPMGRLGTPEEVAATVAFLARSPHLSGTSLPVDGGWLAYGGW